MKTSRQRRNQKMLLFILRKICLEI